MSYPFYNKNLVQHTYLHQSPFQHLGDAMGNVLRGVFVVLAIVGGINFRAPILAQRLIVTEPISPPTPD